MKYYKGYLDEMKVDGLNVTLHGLERTMLSLYWDETLSESDKDYLMDKYKEERMRYLDGIFQFDEQNRQRLKEVERLFEKAMRRVEDVCKRTEEREAQKRIRGQGTAVGLRSHLEIGNLDDTEAICYSDEEQDLWRVLCGEDRDFDPYWGVACGSISFERNEQNESRKQYVSQKTVCGGRSCMKADEGENGFGREFCEMKEAYRLAWEDVMKISRFSLTIEMVY